MWQKDPQDDDDLKLCSHTMMLPTRGQLEGRMIVTAYEHGLDNVTEGGCLSCGLRGGGWFCWCQKHSYRLNVTGLRVLFKS